LPERDAFAASGRSQSSRLLSRTDLRASRPLTALIVLSLDLAWVLVSFAVGFPVRWESIFQIARYRRRAQRDTQGCPAGQSDVPEAAG
jgi:hypothetical protein